MDFRAKIRALPLHSLLFCTFLITRLVEGINYCSSSPGQVVSIKGQSLGEIKTLMDNGETSYGNNRNCIWVIDAGAGSRVWLEVLSSNLQWAPSSAICSGYDYIEIRNGSSSSDIEIINWCGSHKPQYIFSTGRYLYINFRSNSQNIYSYAGIHMRFGTTGPTSCPPFAFKWSMANASICVSVFQENVSWRSAQEHCAWVQSNLVKINSASMAAAVKSKVLQNTSQTSYWIGLHDIAKENKFLWIDGTKPSYERLGSDSGIEENDCVSVDVSSNKWWESSCGSQMPAYACSMLIDGPFPIYDIPKEGDYPEDPMAPASPLVIGLVAAGAALLIIVVIVVVVVVYRHKTSRKSQRRQRRNEKRLGGTEMENSTQPMQQDTTHASTRNQDRTPHVVVSAPTSPAASSSQPYQPSAPSPPEYVRDPQPSPQEVAPPGYDEALRHPVFVYSPSNI